ncbi:hypothetical protein ACIQZO_24830 [Streptomyces sp. NPDC097617]|uniref:hypothetical protein n=1 Tax=Streptomyces sp. NPDC097617 TaxID=3366091 RepID=UPI003804BC35
MRFHERVALLTRVTASATAATAVAVLLGGCSGTPAEQLEDWYGSGGETQLKKLTEDAGRVNEVSMRTIEGDPILLCPNARHIPVGHRLRLTIGGPGGPGGPDGSTPGVPSPLRMHHVSVGATSMSTVHSTSRLLLPLLVPAG